MVLNFPRPDGCQLKKGHPSPPMKIHMFPFSTSGPRGLCTRDREFILSSKGPHDASPAATPKMACKQDSRLWETMRGRGRQGRCLCYQQEAAWRMANETPMRVSRDRSGEMQERGMRSFPSEITCSLFPDTLGLLHFFLHIQSQIREPVFPLRMMPS